MEYLDIYDINGNKTGKTIARGDKNFGENEYIKLATIWIKSMGKYLIQKCSEDKGSEYAVTGGHVSAGNTPIGQASIELEEELGLNVPPDEFTLLGSIIRGHAIFDVFIFEDDSLINKTFTLQKSEVEDILWLDQDQIDNLKDKNLRPSTILQFDKFIKGKDI